MERLNYLLEIAYFLKINDVIAELEYIKTRFDSDTAKLILPIVGEFSSGKTSLINEITEGKKLETASKPTTSVIYEIYFGSKEEKAEIISENEKIKVVENITSLKNDNLNDVKRIKIYDTSKKIDSETVLVDTPGLSSNKPKHIEALSEYLPNADAIFLFSDVNQQVTKSLLDFIDTKKLMHLPLYLVMTKTDTKTKEEVNGIKQYISEEIDLDIENIISVSSKENDLNEFFETLDKIQNEKTEIINKALDYRIEKIADYLKTYIKDLLENTSADTNYKEEIKKEKRKLDKTFKSIDNLITDIRNNIEDVEYSALKQFETHVYSKLNSLIANNNDNIDNEAISMINSTANLVFANYQNEIKRKLYTTASQRKNSELVTLKSIEGIDFSQTEIGQFSYNMNLSEAGQDTVKGISTGIKIGAVIAAVAITAGAAGPATVAGESATGAATTAAGETAAGAATAGTEAAAASSTLSASNLAANTGIIVSSADTVSDIASIRSNQKLKKKMSKQTQKVKEHIGENKEKYKEYLKTYDDYNHQAGQMMKPNQKLGFVEGIVSNTTDGVIGKPERKRMINKFLRESLNPEFKSKLSIISNDLLNDIQDSLNQEATITTDQISENLSELDELSKNEKENFEAYTKTLNQYLKKLT